MVQINVTQGQGLTHAIKAELTNQGYDTSELQGSIWTKVMQEVATQNEQNIKNNEKAIFKGGSDLNGSGKTNFIVQAGIIELAQGLWDKIVALVTGKQSPQQTPQVSQSNQTTETSQVVSTADLEKIAKVPNTRNATPSGVDVPSDLKQNVEVAQKYLLGQLPNLSNDDLQKMGISAEKRDRLMEYIKNITYDTDHDSAQAIGAGIVFSTKCKDTDKLANMVTLLMHEANHCDENYLTLFPEDSETNDLRHRDVDGKPINYNGTPVNTKEEERACETLGLLTTAVLIKNGTLQGYDDYGRYGGEGNKFNPVTKYLDDKNLLKADVDNWVQGYTNYPEGLNNAGLTVEHLRDCNLPENVMAQKLELKPGDVIKIGDKEYKLGNGEGEIVLAPRDSVPVFYMFPQGVTGNSLGTLTFDAVPITQQEKISLFYNIIMIPNVLIF